LAEVRILETFLCRKGDSSEEQTEKRELSRGLVRRRHRTPAIERHLLKQAAMFLSPMSALQRNTDSSLTSR
jgi:hypothetical protein